MGGNEATAFAARYGDRIEKVVYLEAAYDWSYAPFQKGFPTLNPQTPDLRSLDAYRVWYRRTWFGDTPWTPGLEAYLRDITTVASDGTVHPVPSGSVLDALAASNANSSRNYRDVKAPALALYAESFLPMDPSSPSSLQLSEGWESSVMASFRRTSIERASRELSNVVIQTFPKTAHMSILVLQQEPVTAAVKEFLGGAGKQ
jgi:pimeloyl-ACP methyl ester carboxylesterase